MKKLFTSPFLVGLLLLALGGGRPLAAQFVWQRAVGTAANNETAVQMLPVAGGYLTLGTLHRPTSPIDQRLYLSKVSDQGDTLWTRRHFLRRARILYPQAVIEDAAGNVVVTATTFPPTSAPQVGQGVLVKLTAGGDTLWTRRLPQGLGRTDFSKLVLGNDGSYVAIGSVADVPLLFKYSPAGTLLWSQNVPYDASRAGYLQNLLAVPGGYLLVSSPNFGTLKSKYITVDEQGVYQFERLGSRYYDYTLKLDSQGDVLAVGGTLTKRTVQGDSIWSYSYWQLGLPLSARWVAELPGGGYVVAGVRTRSWNVHDIGLAVVDHDGRLLRDTLFIRPQSDNNVAGVALSPAGDYVLAVGADSNGPIGGADQFVFSYRSWARLLATRPAQAAAGEAAGLVAYPNPTAGALTVAAADGGALGRGQWTLLDMLGRTLGTGALAGQGQVPMSLAGQPPGLYLLRLTDERGQRIRTLRIERTGE